MKNDEGNLVSQIRRLISQIAKPNPISDIPLKMYFVIIFSAGALLLVSLNISAFVQPEEDPLSLLCHQIVYSIMRSYFSVGGIALVIILLLPLDKMIAHHRMRSIGMVNRVDLVPRLLGKTISQHNEKVTILEFSTKGIPLITWEDKQAEIEAALNITITKMTYNEGKRSVLLYTVPAKSDLPDIAPWDNRYLSDKSFVLTLGEGYTGTICVDLTRTPHILLGGSTGSGKSVLLKLLLMQAIKKGAIVCISDFKGGVDFPPAWHAKCRMCFEEQETLDLLSELVEELHRRKNLLAASGYPNIDAYHQATGNHLPRYIFGCDEVAEILDKTGLTKEQKEIIGKLESKLSVIARLGRAFGIHLILATQRPDANILSGQIKNNIGYRICGRADNVLSQIILDSTDAAEQIPEDAQGRFLLYDGTVFQAYWYDDSSLS